MYIYIYIYTYTYIYIHIYIWLKDLKGILGSTATDTQKLKFGLNFQRPSEHISWMWGAGDVFLGIQFGQPWIINNGLRLSISKLFEK